MSIFSDPLEQFTISALTNIPVNHIINITTPTWTFVWILLLLNFILNFNANFWKMSFINLVVENIWNLIKGILTDSIKTRNNSAYFNFLFIFLLISSINLIGLIPYSWTISSWYLIILYIALTYFIYINIYMVLNKQWQIFDIFLPTGTPLIIAPFLIIVEIISYFSRVISLSVRLFANMLSGHALLKILISFSWDLLVKLNVKTLFLSMIIWICVTGILILEFLVAILQAYVFALLLTIYWSDAWNDSH